MVGHYPHFVVLIVSIILAFLQITLHIRYKLLVYILTNLPCFYWVFFNKSASLFMTLVKVNRL